MQGLVIEQIQASFLETGKKKIIYLGDGGNDFCPSLKLVAGDCVMPRKNFPLWTRIQNNSELMKARVYEWNDGEELARVLLELVNNPSSEDR